MDFDEMNYDLSDPDCPQADGVGFVQLGDSDLCFIDDQSVRTLELIENNIDPTNKKQTLYGYLSVNTSTTIGQRLLREAILRPLYHLPTLENRLDCIDYLINRVDTLAMINISIKKFGNCVDLDNFTANLNNLTSCRSSSTVLAEKRLDAISIIETLVSQADHLAAILQDNEQTILNLCRQQLQNPAYVSIRDVIVDYLDPEIKPVRGKRIRIFRIKGGVDSLFDIARGTYLAALNDVESYQTELRKQTGIEWKVNCTETRGYYLSIQPEKVPKKASLDHRLYLNMHRTRYLITCTTKELMQLNVRANMSYENSMKLANDILSNCLSTMTTHIGSIAQLIDLIGMLDLTTSLAMVASNSGGKLVRPQFTKDTTIIEGGRHPVMESILECNKLTFVENDTTFKTKTNNFMLVTGPNMGGKTIYLKQVAIIQIMSQIGSYVPAKSAHIKLVNRIVARSGMNNDNLSNCSSFMWEMKGMATALIDHRNGSCENTLYLIDEIGRGTSIDCGASFSFAIAEELSLRDNSFTLFATHFDQVFHLSSIYKNIIPYHFEYEIQKGTDGSTTRIKTNHKLAPGEAERVNYGIRLAESCGFPAEIISLACEGLSDCVQDKC